jgi:hypothetical protein
MGRKTIKKSKPSNKPKIQFKRTNIKKNRSWINKIGRSSTKKPIHHNKKILLSSPMKKHIGYKTSDSYCTNASKNYKNVCNKVWNVRCTGNLTPSQIKAIVRDAKICAQERTKVTSKCFGGKFDAAHKGAVTKMKSIEGHCKKYL